MPRESQVEEALDFWGRNDRTGHGSMARALMVAARGKSRRATGHLPLLPGRNRYGVTDLDPALQAMEIPDPVVKYGAVDRSCPIAGGTWQFYTDHYKFIRLWSTPATIRATDAAVCVEPSFSIGPETPPWRALELIGKKRWIARYWQDHLGIRIVADLHVHPSFLDLALLGIPKGWRSYATRWRQDSTWDEVEEVFDLAADRAGTDDILFSVFGGNSGVGHRCRSNGWLWFRQTRDWKRGDGWVLPGRVVHRMPPPLARKKRARPAPTTEPDTEPGEAPGDDE